MGVNTTININEFEKKFNKEYSFLYENGDNVAGYNEALMAFDLFVEKNKSFVRKFVEHRMDFISSDREAVAFMFALDSLS